MQVIENHSPWASVNIKLAITLAVANVILCVYILGPFGILASLPGTYFCYTVIRVERLHTQQGNIYISESGFIIEKHSTTQVPWSAVSGVRMHILRSAKMSVCQLLFTLADGAEYPEGYESITEKSLASKYVFGSGIFCANIMGYKLSPAEIEAAFKAAFENWKKANVGQAGVPAASSPAAPT